MVKGDSEGGVSEKSDDKKSMSSKGILVHIILILFFAC